DGADIAVERSTVPVALDEVLLEFRPERLEQEAQMPDHRVVAQDRMLRLNQVIDRHGDDGQNHPAEHPPRPWSHSGSPPDRHQDDEGCCDRQETSHRISSPLTLKSRPCGAALSSIMNFSAPLGKKRLDSALRVRRAALRLRRAVIMDDESAARKRREPVERYREVLT